MLSTSSESYQNLYSDIRLVNSKARSFLSLCLYTMFGALTWKKAGSSKEVLQEKIGSQICPVSLDVMRSYHDRDRKEH